jgi:hypothetical protein
MIAPTFAKVSNNNVTNGGAPGISASFLNEEERILKLVNALACDANVTSDLSGNVTVASLLTNAAVGTLTGTTSGSVIYFQPMIGNLLVTICQAQNYNNTTSTRQHITLPHAYTRGGPCFIGGILNPTTTKGCYFYNGGTSGTLLNCAQQLWGGSSAGGTLNVVTQAKCVNWYEVLGAADTIEFDGNLGGNSNGWLLMFGN